MLINYTEAGLTQMISNQIEENLHLDYKGAGSLIITDQKKIEVTKDISAFANSDGGQVIYGIREFDEKAQKHLPEKIDPIDRTVISKEWLEQIINNIQPKIHGLTIHPISLSSSPNHVAYVVNVPKSNTAHQSSDKKYYKRHNFMAIAMEDYEIKDIINRLSSPDLTLILDSSQTTYASNVLKFPIILSNESKRLAKDVKFTIIFNNYQNYNFEKTSGFLDLSHINPGKKLYSTKGVIEIYNGLNTHLGYFQIRLHENIAKVNISTAIYCDNMFPSKQNFEIIIDNDIPSYNILQ